jgi:hypothetical protein
MSIKSDGRGNQELDSRIAFVKRGCHQTGIPVQTQHELSQIVGANGKSIEMIKEGI